MAKILVTGGAGFVGKAVCKALERRGDQPVALVHEGDAGLAKLRAEIPGIPVAEADICDVDAVERAFSAHKPEGIVHCAAIVGVLASMSNPADVFRVNLDGSVNVMQAMVRHGVQRMIHISSEEIYGNFREKRINEDHPQNPLFAYGVTKSAIEHLGRTFALTDDLEVINLRTSWVYGPGFPRTRVPVDMIRAAAKREAFHVPHGKESRIDHTYIDDLVQGVLKALDLQVHPFDAYHIASGVAPTLQEIADILNRLTDGEWITVGEGTYKHAGAIEIPRKGALDCSRAREAFGYVPQFEIEAGLSAYLGALKNEERAELEEN